MRRCVECQEMFDPHSAEKRRAGGLITHCPECSDEPVTRYLGVASGDGKQASISILSFPNQKAREKYARYHQRASGLHKGKSCQLHQPGLSDPGVNFSTVTADEARNHKGKA